jgi:hypothetical protein
VAPLPHYLDVDQKEGGSRNDVAMTRQGPTFALASEGRRGPGHHGSPRSDLLAGRGIPQPQSLVPINAGIYIQMYCKF